MKIIDNPGRDQWKNLTQRPQFDLSFLQSAVRNILHRVKQSGDEALRALTEQFDKVVISRLDVTADEISDAEKSLSEELKTAIRTAASNIEKFHAAQRRETLEIETMPGIRCWRKGVPIDRVGIYIPGGSAPLFSTVLMLAIPARLAGCQEIVLCTPPDKSGKINAAILFAAKLTGVTKIFKVGGAQAIGAMAYGTETIPAVFKIFGPGNQYVTKAKQLVTEDGLAIDMPAGPSEVLVFADHSSEPSFIAADLLSQAEHGEDSQVILVLLKPALLPRIQDSLKEQLERLPRKGIAEKALANSAAVIFNDRNTALEFINAYAPEHLILNIEQASSAIDKISNAGSVFIGNFSPEAMGDYASGTNHTLPTNGYARAYAGVSLESFMKYITFQEATREGIQKLGPVVEAMAEAEELVGHKSAIRIRLDYLNQRKA